MKRHPIKGLHILIAGLVLLIVTGCLMRPREPVFQDKQLSIWMNELNREWKEEEPLANVVARQAAWTNVVRSVGTNALPYYLKWIPDSSQLSHQNFIMLAFQILGPEAEPAIPGLVHLLKNDDDSSHAAAFCLAAIGPAAVPAVSELFATSTKRKPGAAIWILGEMGPRASAAIPLLLEIARTNRDQSIAALYALLEVETNTAALMPLLVEHLDDTNGAGVSAYGLARLGEPGIPFLLQSLTNEPRIIRHSAVAALSAGFQKEAASAMKAMPPAPVGRLKTVFNSFILRAGLRGYSQGDYQVAAQTAEAYTNNPNPLIRSAASNVLNYLNPILLTNPIPRSVRDGTAANWGEPPPARK